MTIHLIGDGAGRTGVFDRSFFNTALGDVINQCNREHGQKLTLFLLDGSTLDVCMIKELSENYMLLNAFQDDKEASTTVLNVIPYNLIYRVQITSTKSDETERVGFRWTPVADGAPPGGARSGRKDEGATRRTP